MEDEDGEGEKEEEEGAEEEEAAGEAATDANPIDVAERRRYDGLAARGFPPFSSALPAK